MAIILSKRSRRAFLGGAGALLALPFLDSIGGEGARADDTPPRRLLTFYVPNGIHMSAWTPQKQGAGFDLPPILAPLAKVQSKLLVLTGLANKPAIPDVVGDHAAGTGSFLTARHVVKTEGPNIKNGISMDQAAAAALGQSSRIASLQLGIDGGSSVGDCDSGYSCAYARNISWASETQPLPKTVNPQVVWDLLFGGYDPLATAEEKARRELYKKSLLDYVSADAKALRARVGKSDAQKLDEYLTGVSELEKRIAGMGSGFLCGVPARPSDNLDYPSQVTAMNELMALAFQCDITRVITFMLGNAGSGRSYEFIGIKGGHHELSHHQDLPENLAALQAIDTWEVQQLAALLEKLDSMPEGNGTVLDNCAVLFSSEIEDGNSHSHYNLPVLVAGGLGGALKSGRHLVFTEDEPIANLFISLLEGAGVPTPTFGDDGTGPLDLT
jgi:hypothetical protein